MFSYASKVRGDARDPRSVMVAASRSTHGPALAVPAVDPVGNYWYYPAEYCQPAWQQVPFLGPEQSPSDQVVALMAKDWRKPTHHPTMPYVVHATPSATRVHENAPCSIKQGRKKMHRVRAKRKSKVKPSNTMPRTHPVPTLSFGCQNNNGAGVEKSACVAELSTCNVAIAKTTLPLPQQQ